MINYSFYLCLLPIVLIVYNFDYKRKHVSLTAKCIFYLQFTPCGCVCLHFSKHVSFFFLWCDSIHLFVVSWKYKAFNVMYEYFNISLALSSRLSYFSGESFHFLGSCWYLFYFEYEMIMTNGTLQVYIESKQNVCAFTKVTVVTRITVLNLYIYLLLVD